MNTSDRLVTTPPLPELCATDPCNKKCCAICSPGSDGNNCKQCLSGLCMSQTQGHCTTSAGSRNGSPCPNCCTSCSPTQPNTCLTCNSTGPTPCMSLTSGTCVATSDLRDPIQNCQQCSPRYGTQCAKCKDPIHTKDPFNQPTMTMFCPVGNPTTACTERPNCKACDLEGNTGKCATCTCPLAPNPDGECVCPPPVDCKLDPCNMLCCAVGRCGGGSCKQCNVRYGFACMRADGFCTPNVPLPGCEQCSPTHPETCIKCGLVMRLHGLSGTNTSNGWKIGDSITAKTKDGKSYIGYAYNNGTWDMPLDITIWQGEEWPTTTDEYDINSVFWQAQPKERVIANILPIGKPTQVDVLYTQLNAGKCDISPSRPPTPHHTTRPPTPHHTTRPPTPHHTTRPPTPHHTTRPPTPHHTTRPPTPHHTTRPPTPHHTTRPPTPHHTTRPPTPHHTTRPPTPHHTTRPPTPHHTTRPPTPHHTTRPPTPHHTTRPPTPGTPSPHPGPNTHKPAAGLSAGAIAGITIGSFIFLVILYYSIKKKR